MAQSRKRKKPQILKRQKNVFRGALADSDRDFATVVVEELTELPANDVDYLMNWIAGYPAKKKGLLPIVPARKYSDLVATRRLNTRNVRLELLWLTRFLSENLGAIEHYGSTIRPLQQQWIHDSEVGVVAMLQSIEDKCGFSAWLISARIACLQKFQGLEAQKSYQHAIHLAAPYSFAAFLAYYISQRNEPAVTLARLRQSVERALASPNVIEGLIPFTKVFVGAHQLSSLESSELFDYLSISASISLVDSYEAMLAVIPELWRRGLLNELPAQTLDLLRQIAKHDYRAAKICSVFSGISEPPSFAVCQADAAFIKGNLLHAYSLALEQLRSDAGDLDALRTLCSVVALTDTPVSEVLPPTFGELARLLVDLKQRGALFERAVADSSKLLANLKHLPFAAPLISLFAAEWSSAPLYGKSEQIQCFFGTERFNPLQAIFLGETTGSALLATIPAEDKDAVLLSNVATSFLFEHDFPDEFAAGETRTEWEAYAALTLGRFDQALACARKLAVATSSYGRRIGTVIELHALCKTDRADDAILKLGTAVASDPDLSHVVPASMLVAGRRWRQLRHLKNKLPLSITLNISILKQSDPDAVRNRRFAYDEFLRSQGVDRPSSLNTKTADLDRPSLIYFLRYICVPSVMDVSFQTFKTSRGLEEERLQVCNILSEMDPAHSDSYADEIKELTRRLTVQDGLRDVDQSRLYVSTDALLTWGQREFAEGFDRYKMLLKAGVGFTPESEYETIVSRLLSGDSTLYDDFLKYPKDEADNLLAEMYQSVRAQYLMNTDYGLDAYLSMRIRHGSLSGHLRGPLEERHLVLVRDADTGIYSAISEDSPLLIEATDGDQAALSECLKEFSIKIDDMIDDMIKTRLQIRSVDKPAGFFTLESVPIAHLFLRSRIQEHTTLEEFLSNTILMTEVYLQRDLGEVRKYLNEVVKEKLEQAISDLKLSAANRLSVICYDHVGREIANSVPEVVAALEGIIDWFRPSQAHQIGTLRSFDEIIEIGIAATKNARRGFEPIISQTVEDLGLQSGDVLLLFSDLLFTLLDNVYRHSGLGNTPAVHIFLSAQEEEDRRFIVTLRVESEVAMGVRRPATIERLDRIRKLIESGSYRSLVNREGGTGLIKIQRLLASNPRNTIDFGFVSDQLFFVQVEVSLLILTDKQSESMGLS